MHEVVTSWDCTDLYVGCSGNFTVERVLTDLGATLHSNDVTIYSYAIGRLFCGLSVDLVLKESVKGQFGWLEPFIISDLGKVASVMLLTRVLMGYTSDGVFKDNAHYRRMEKAYRDNWQQLQGKTIERLSGLVGSIVSYHNGDVVQWLQNQVPLDAGFISYPPFYAETNDYEQMFKKLEVLFDWPKPTYPAISIERLQTVFMDAVRQKEHWMIGVNAPLEGMDSHMVGMSQTTNRGIPIVLYASSGVSRVVTAKQEIDPVLLPRLGPGDEIGNSIHLVVLSRPQFHYLRSQYMNINIRPGEELLGIGVVVDDRLVGAYAFSGLRNIGKFADARRIYLLSDFPVFPSDYPRLAKLVLYAALSKESKLLAERVMRHRIRFVLTTAYTDNYVSMKYRGLFKLHSRVEVDLIKSYGKRYQISYLASMGDWCLAEGLTRWKKKHGMVDTDANAHYKD